MALEELCRFRWTCKGPSRRHTVGLYKLPGVGSVDDQRCSDNEGVVKALNWGEVDWCGAQRRGSLVLGCSKVDECVDEGIDTNMVWTKAHHAGREG